MTDFLDPKFPLVFFMRDFTVIVTVIVTVSITVNITVIVTYIEKWVYSHYPHRIVDNVHCQLLVLCKLYSDQKFNKTLIIKTCVLLPKMPVFAFQALVDSQVGKIFFARIWNNAQNRQTLFVQNFYWQELRIVYSKKAVINQAKLRTK